MKKNTDKADFLFPAENPKWLTANYDTPDPAWEDEKKFASKKAKRFLKTYLKGGGSIDSDNYNFYDSIIESAASNAKEVRRLQRAKFENHISAQISKFQVDEFEYNLRLEQLKTERSNLTERLAYLKSLGV